MDATKMLAAALDISDPWHIEEVELKAKEPRTDNRGKVKREAAAAKSSNAPGEQPAVSHVLSGKFSDKELHIAISF